LSLRNLLRFQEQVSNQTLDERFGRVKPIMLEKLAKNARKDPESAKQNP